MYVAQLVLFSLFIALMPVHAEQVSSQAQSSQPIEYVTIAILAKDKAHTLPLYLSCIEKQTWPAEKTYIYIRTNNNNDETVSVLLNWIDRVWERYAGIYFDDSDVPEPVHTYGQHEWNYERFKVLGKIRQESVDWARAYNSHYFVVDCDNFIQPNTLASLLNTNLPIVAPLLRTGYNLYSNYHAAIDENGYNLDCRFYNQLWAREIVGLVQVPVVHCTYLVRYEALDKILYDDQSGRYEYVIFSDSARRRGIPQYLDTRSVYGRLTFAESVDQLLAESWLAEFA